MTQALRTLALTLAVVACASAWSQTSSAQSIIARPHTGSRDVTLDVHLGVAWRGFGLATGVRVGIPLLKNGFVPQINNSVSLSVGADLYFVRYRNRSRDEDRYGPGLGIPVLLHWEFYFTPKWSAFAELGINIYLHPGFFQDDNAKFFDGGPGAWIIGAVGGRLQISDAFGLVLRVGSPYTAFGITFSF